MDLKKVWEAMNFLSLASRAMVNCKTLNVVYVVECKRM